MTTYKRGTVTESGKTYGFYPDGSRYRIYENKRPFMEIVDLRGTTILRVRQATELGYTDVPVMGCVDIAYPNSQLRRSRTIGGGMLVNALTCGQNLNIFVRL